MWWGGALQGQAQQAPPPVAERETLPVVSEVRFAGNTFFSDAELARRVRTQPNRRFLGVPGLTWWRWLYRFGASGTLGEHVGEALMSSGEPPAYLDPAVVAADVERLRLFYLQEGFRDAAVVARFDTLAAGERIRVIFDVEAGTPTYVRQVRYDGLEALPPEQRRPLVRGSLLRPARLDPAAPAGTPLQFTARHQRYSEPVLLEERRRLLVALRNEGYAAATRDSIRALILPQSEDSFDVVFRVRPGPRFRFGDVHFDVIGPEAGDTLPQDTLYHVPPVDSLAGGVVSVQMRQESKLASDVLMRALQVRPGDWYDQSRLLTTKRRLEATGLFTFTDLVPVVQDTTRPAPGAAPRLPHRIELRTRQRHQIRMETFMLQRSGVMDELGTGIGVSYENANLLGHGETLRIRTTGSIAADVDSTFFTSAQAEVATSLTYPYLIGPLGRLEEWLALYDGRTRLSLSLLTARYANMGLIIRGRGNARFRLEMQHSPTITSLVDVLDLSLSNPDTLDNFKAVFLDNLLRPVEDPVQRRQIEEDYTQPQMNSALRYTFRSARVNPLRRDQGYSYEAAFELGGNLTYLLDRFLFSPGEVEGSLPGLPFFDGEKTESRLVYRQYLRAVGDLRRYKPLGRRTVLAGKAVVGIAHPLGRSDVIPFDRRFYSGGASSVRGWGLRRLGPGAAEFISRTDSTGTTPGGERVANILGGDLKLEMGVELRGTLLRTMLGADWIGVLFADAGNVWFGPRNPGFGTQADGGEDGRFHLGRFYRELGVGSGVGLRIAWEYLIVRLDLAYKVYDPMRSRLGLLPDGLVRPQLHFGIGHAF